MKQTEFRFPISKTIGDVSGILTAPKDAEKILVFAHGAGAGMNHPFMTKMSEELANIEIATLRFNFPYMEKKKRTPDPKPIAVAAIRSAVEAARKKLPGITLLAGGKSFGGRMTSTAESEKHLNGLKGIIFFGFPLHPPGKPSDERAEHLYKITIPMLFFQGTKDSLADLQFLRPVCKKIGKLADLQIFEGAVHSFNIRGREKEDVIAELAQKVKTWSENL